MAEFAIEMVQVIRDYLPTGGDSGAKCDPAICDEMFGYSGDLYQRIERLRNPQELPWLQSAGICVQGPPAIYLHYKALCCALRPLCKTYGWQGISNGSKSAHSSVRYGGPAIPEIAAEVLVAIEKPARRLLEMTNDVRSWDWQSAAIECDIGASVRHAFPTNSTPVAGTMAGANFGRSARAISGSESQSQNGFLGGAALADALCVHPRRRGAFFQQLGRERIRLGDDAWLEVRDPRPRSPRYHYRSDLPALRKLAEKYQEA
jgi:hypothetical protein